MTRRTRARPTYTSMTEAKLNDFVALLNDPYRDYPLYFTPESVLCKRAAETITKLRRQTRRLDARLQREK